VCHVTRQLRTFPVARLQIGEKELGLRSALRTMGMSDTAYWASWAAWEFLLAFISGHLITIYGERYH
jgi:hypothetical protein